MKIPIITFLLVSIGSSLGAELIPVREPKEGESRPSWWGSLWMNHVVVIEGEVDWNEDREPEIKITVDRGLLEAKLGKENNDLLETRTKFRIGRIKPKRLLFASPGITTADGGFAELATGKMEDKYFLLPVIEINGRQRVWGVKNKSGGIFIFRYGSSMMETVPLVFEDSIPAGGIASAEALFKHRSSFDYLNQEKKTGEQAGTGQPATRSESKSEGGDKPQPEAEGRSR